MWDLTGLLNFVTSRLTKEETEKKPETSVCVLIE